MNIELDNVYGLMLIFVRTGALFMAVPVLGGAMIPVQSRVGLGLLTAVVLLPICPAAPLVGVNSMSVLLAMIYEFLIGMIMGLAVQCVFSCVQFAADTITNEVGLLRAETFDPTSGDAGQGGGMTTLLYYFSLMIFLAMGIHRQVITALAQSFRALPAGGMYTKGLSVD
jgi:flagellar biosynthetic protein FliR